MRNLVTILLTMLKRLRRTKPEPAELPTLLYATGRLLPSSKPRHTEIQHESIW